MQEGDPLIQIVNMPSFLQMNRSTLSGDVPQLSWPNRNFYRYGEMINLQHPPQLMARRHSNQMQKEAQ